MGHIMFPLTHNQFELIPMAVPEVKTVSLRL